MKVYFSPLKSLCHPSWSKAKQLKNSTWLCWLIEDSETFPANFDPCFQSLKACPFLSLQRIIPAETQRRETLIYGLQVTSCRQIPWKHGRESLTGEDTHCLIYSVVYCLFKPLFKPLSTALIVIKWVSDGNSLLIIYIQLLIVIMITFGLPGWENHHERLSHCTEHVIFSWRTQ